MVVLGSEKPTCTTPPKETGMASGDDEDRGRYDPGRWNAGNPGQDRTAQEQGRWGSDSQPRGGTAQDPGSRSHGYGQRTPEFGPPRQPSYGGGGGGGAEHHAQGRGGPQQGAYPGSRDDLRGGTEFGGSPGHWGQGTSDWTGQQGGRHSPGWGRPAGPWQGPGRPYERGRQGYGGEPGQGGQQGYGGYGEGRQTGYPGQPDLRGSDHDADYHQWREEQLRHLDNDYQTWRQDRYRRFSDEFNSWRQARQSGRSDSSTGVNPGATDPAPPEGEQGGGGLARKDDQRKEST